MKGKFLNIFFLLNILELFNSAIEIQDKIVLKDYNMGNMNYSMEKDLGQCACDLSKFCDYKCDCATYDDGKKCDESYEYEDRMDEYLCKSRKRAFEYNKDKAGINLKDHIHSLMCVQFDKTVDLGEFYKKEPEEPDTLAREWVSQFFPTKKEEGDFTIYKPDSNGYCVESKAKNFNKNEYSCILSQTDENTLTGAVTDDKKFGESSKANAITMNKKEVTEILRMDNNKKIVDFKNLWKSDENNDVIKNANGYIQGSPIRIINDNKLYKQFYFPIIDTSGACLLDDSYNNAISFQTILFKNDAIYACIKSSGDITDSSIYKNLCVNSQSFCSNPNCDKTRPIKCEESSKIEGVNILLNIYTSKTGKEYSPNEEILGSKIYINKTPVDGVLIFKIKFIDVSYSSKINTKNEKITSLIPLSKEILDALEEVDE